MENNSYAWLNIKPFFYFFLDKCLRFAEKQGQNERNNYSFEIIIGKVLGVCVFLFQWKCPNNGW